LGFVVFGGGGVKIFHPQKNNRIVFKFIPNIAADRLMAPASPHQAVLWLLPKINTTKSGSNIIS